MTSDTVSGTTVTRGRDRTAWGPVLLVTATSFVLATGEFLPPSLLPSMAASLNITEGQAGQSVTVTALAGLVMAPLIGTLFPRLDRRTLLSGLAVSATISNGAVAVSTNVVVLLLARLLLGAAIGGFWAMSLAVAARLSASHHLRRSVTLVNTGATLATVAGVPTGIWLGSIFDWRTVFAGIAVTSLVIAIALRAVLPDVPSDAATGVRALRETLRTPGLARGSIGHTLVMLANFAAFTYIRPALALTPDLDEGHAAVLVAVFGVGSVAGGLVTGALVDRHLTSPLLLAAGIATLSLFPGRLWLITVAIVAWGSVFGGWLIIVSTWMGRVAPSRREAGGGLVVAGYQSAIMLGAGIGGLIVDHAGIRVTLMIATAAAIIGGILFGSARQADPGRSTSSGEPAATPTST